MSLLSSIGPWRTGPRTVEVSCEVDIEQTQEFLHAHAIPEGIDLRPGDEVTVHGAPTQIAFGEHIIMRCRATVVRAGYFERIWTQAISLLEITELYEVGFSPKLHAAGSAGRGTP
jgi:hypothetical protein